MQWETGARFILYDKVVLGRDRLQSGVQFLVQM